MNAELLGALKPGAVLVNIARGEIVNETDLLAALDSGKLRGAVLDVYTGEFEALMRRAGLDARLLGVSFEEVDEAQVAEGAGHGDDPQRLFVEAEGLGQEQPGEDHLGGEAHQEPHQHAGVAVRLQHTETYARIMRIALPIRRDNLHGQLGRGPLASLGRPDPRLADAPVADDHVHVAVVVKIQQSHAVVLALRVAKRLPGQEVFRQAVVHLGKCEEPYLFAVLAVGGARGMPRTTMTRS